MNTTTNYTSKIFWACNSCGFKDEHFKFVYRYTEIPISSTNVRTKRQSSQHCPKCDSGDVNTNPK